MKITRITAMAIVTERFTVVFEELYGKKYSTSQVSRMFDYARKEKQISLAVKQTPKRAFSTSFHYLKYNYNIRSMIYTTNWIERLNKTFKKSLKVRGALPNVEAGLVLLYGVATEMSCYNYPITAFVHEQQHFRWD